MRKSTQRAAGLGTAPRIPGAGLGRALLALCLAAAVLSAAACSGGNGSAKRSPPRQGELAEAFGTPGNANASAEPAAEAPAQQAAQSPEAARPVVNKQLGVADMRYKREEAEPPGSETYDRISENGFVEAARSPLSTFSVDVDTASYSNTRRFLNEGRLPPPDAVRVEELINYFSYDYPQPTGDSPFSVMAEAADCPWNPRHRLVRVGLQSRRVAPDALPPANLVFLIDVSGSMQDENKLPLVKSSLRLLANQLSGRDRVGVVVYAGSTGLVLPSTPDDRRGEILSAIERLEAGGSTNGGAGLQLAYRVARENFIQGGVNRVVLATDGDFNVGVTSDDELVRMVEEQRRTGVSLSVLGYGMGNLKDSRMEKLADKGDGNYAYVDTLAEARKVLGEQVGGTLYTIAKDVKVQVEFNPRHVSGYRLVGYENRLLRDRDFEDDRVDAGEIGAGHTVTALYEVVPAALESAGGEMLTVRLRYKEPQESESKLVSVGLPNGRASYRNASADFKFASAVAEFGMLLRDSRHKGEASFDAALGLAREGAGQDPRGHRAEFVRLLETAKALAAREGGGR